VTKATWPLVANGLPANLAAARPRVAAAAAQARTVRLPALFDEPRARELVWPSSKMAGDFRDYQALVGRGWAMILYSIDQIGRGGAGAKFARENAGLYIESVYDGHFAAAQIGKNLLVNYKKLGGAGAFGRALPQAEVERLAAIYSEPRYRLYPHTAVKYGT